MEECSVERTFLGEYVSRQISGGVLKRQWGLNGLKYGAGMRC